MPRMISTETMVTQLEGLLETEDLTEWENEFVESMVEKRDGGKIPSLSDKQIAVLERLYRKHFA